jgi:hypothetical protein
VIDCRFISREQRVSLLGSSPLGPFELRRCFETIASCPFRILRDASLEREGVYVRCLALDNAEAAVGWLRSAAISSDDMSVLRQIVTTDPRSTAWLSNEQVIQEIGYRIGRRELCLLASQRVARPSTIEPGQPGASPTPGVTPSQLRPAAAEAPVAATVPPADDLTDVNQAAQAAALEDAARDGVPFCEECEKARQKAAQSNAA